MKRSDKFEKVREMIQGTGIVWADRREIPWLTQTYYAVDGDSLIANDGISRNLIRAGLIGALYGEFCSIYFEEKACCQMEGLEMGLKICLEDLNLYDDSDIDNLTKREVIDRELNYVLKKLEDYYTFRFPDDDWRIQFSIEMHDVTGVTYEEKGFGAMSSIDKEMVDNHPNWLQEKDELYLGEVFGWATGGFFIE